MPMPMGKVLGGGSSINAMVNRTDLPEASAHERLEPI